MNLRNRPVRVVAAAGAVLAAGTTTFLAVAAGTASADEPGRCTQNVNVREDPDPHAKIVALCEAGKQVKIGEARNGFVHLDELGGWASKDYVKADDSASDEHDAATDDNRSSDNSSNDDSSDGSNDSSGDGADGPARHATHATHPDGGNADQGNDDSSNGNSSTSGAARGLGDLLD